MNKRYTPPLSKNIIKKHKINKCYIPPPSKGFINIKLTNVTTTILLSRVIIKFLLTINCLELNNLQLYFFGWFYAALIQLQGFEVAD